MLVTIKTLQQHIFKIDIDTSETVKALKTKIENERGKDSYPVAGQKLIYAGKILDDNKALAEYKIEEGKFIVAMVTKAKPAPKVAEPPAKPATPTDASSSSAPAETPAAAATPAASESTATPAAVPAATTTTPSATQPDVATSQGALVTSEGYETTVQNIIALGFPRDHVETALRASFNNPDRAVEYLMGEMPTGGLPDPGPQQVQAPASEAAAAAPTAADNPPAAAAPPSSGAGGGSSIAQLVQSNPQLQQMIEQVRTNPDLLNDYMERIGVQNPELLRFISEHQQDFVNYINDPNAGQPSAGQPYSIAVSPRERDEINQLKAMGFSELDSLQAYIACGRDLALAINFLISSGGDGM